MSKFSAALVLLCLTVVAQAYQATASSSAPSATLTILKSKYCLGPAGGINLSVLTHGHTEPLENYAPDTITLRLHVAATYHNLGSRPLIVPTDSQSLVSIGLTPSQLSEIQQLHPYQLAKEKPQNTLPDVSDTSPAWPFFVTIPPGGSQGKYFGASIVIRVHNPSSKEDPDFLGKKVYLQLELFSRQWSPRLLSHLAKKWESYGVLWTGTVRSTPIEIDVPASPEISDCSNEYRID